MGKCYVVYVSSPHPNFTILCACGSVICYFVCLGCGGEFGFLYCYDV